MSSQTLTFTRDRRREGGGKKSCIIQRAASTPPGFIDKHKGDAQERTSRLTRLPWSLSLPAFLHSPRFVHCHQYPPTTTSSTSSMYCFNLLVGDKSLTENAQEWGGGWQAASSLINRKQLVSTHTHTHTCGYRKRQPQINCAVCRCSNRATLPPMPLTFWMWGPWSLHPTSSSPFLPLWQTPTLIHHITQLMTQGPSFTSHRWGGGADRGALKALKRHKGTSRTWKGGNEAKVTEGNRRQDRMTENGKVSVERW